MTFSDGRNINLGNVKGSKGDKGDQGEQGLKGDKGDKGDKGTDGINGTNGVDGKDGVDGTNGINGADGVGIENVTVASDGVLTVTLTNGTVLNLGNIKGADGIGITKSEINAIGELVLTYSDGTTANLGKVKGEDGQDGADGRGIQSMSISIDGELIVTYTDSTVVNLGNIKGEKGDKGDRGEKGEQGAAGRGIAKTELVNGELIITYTDGTSDNLGNITSGSTKTDTSYLIFTLLEDDTYSVRINPTYADIKVVVIPSTYNGKSVTQVNESGFINCANLERITIPESITVFGADAFKDCSNLSIVHYEGQLDSWFNVTMSGNIYASPCVNGARMYVGNQFELVENIVIPSNITTIKFALFDGCTSIKTVKLHSNIKSIKRSAFRDCINLTEINIPASVKEIQMCAFYKSGLTSAIFELTDDWTVDGEPMTWIYNFYQKQWGSDQYTKEHDIVETYDLSDSAKAAAALKGPVKVLSATYSDRRDHGYSTENYYNKDWTHK